MALAIDQFIGLDYGSKRAGTTVLAAVEHGRLRCWSSRAKADADAFVYAWCRARRPAALFIDAPLSLPGVYRGLPETQDYFYRAADRALRAMSPMFLGGLTARAMQLGAKLRQMDMALYEVYPGGLAGELALDPQVYKKSKQGIPAILKSLSPYLPVPVEPEAIESWHHVDALLAWLSGYRYQRGEALAYGREEEGRIFI